MFRLPTKGFASSVKKHNVAVDALAEWIEACVTFDDERVSESTIMDILMEGNCYRSQDFAKERIQDAFLELRRRSRCLGAVSPYAIEHGRVTRVTPWQQSPSYAFCLMVALQVPYRPYFKARFGTDYNEQGSLFEQLTMESVSRLGWCTHSVGWSRKETDSLSDRVEAIATFLGEPARPESVERWTTTDANDGGLDVICHLPFEDGWSGRPVFYVQCASGEGWKNKLTSPQLRLWDKLLDVATSPRRGVSIPFALLKDEFRRAARGDELSLLMDRHRICAPVSGLNSNWVSPVLSAALNEWTASRIAVLPNAD